MRYAAAHRCWRRPIGLSPGLVTRAVVADAVAEVPDEWLADADTFGGIEPLRAAYADQLLGRLEARNPVAAGADRRPRRSRRQMTAERRRARGLRIRGSARGAPGGARRAAERRGGALLPAAGLPALYAPSSTTADLRRSTPGPIPRPIRQALAATVQACEAASAAGRDARGQFFRWLTAPRSTVIQPGPVHTGLTDDPVG